MGLTGSNKKEYQREYMRKLRSNKEGLTDDGSNKVLLSRPNRLNGDGNVEMVANDYDPEEMLPDGRLRYLVLSDKQVLDRKTVPYPRATERRFKPLCGNKVDRYVKIINSCDKMLPPGGSIVVRESMLRHIMVGFNGMKLSDIKEGIDKAG